MTENTVSQRFNAADADLTILSADNVAFKVHRKNLEFHSDVFANMFSSATHVPEESINLSETSAVLEILFQYMYRQPQPNLENVAFDVCAGAAEAAEKYLVYSALSSLRERMRKHIDKHALKVLSFAMQHDLKDIGNEAARNSLGFSLKDAAAVLTPESFVTWAIFHDEWHSKARNSLAVCIHNAGKHQPAERNLLASLMRLPETGYAKRDGGYVRNTFLSGEMGFLDLELYPKPPVAFRRKIEL
ncbi:hypothetical protein C8F01DRAFT_1105954 [Mycena amicta]|nr:hypothetical protein C8F01DRAFT_1105954 [Mycena amicta]